MHLFDLPGTIARDAAKAPADERAREEEMGLRGPQPEKRGSRDVITRTAVAVGFAAATVVTLLPCERAMTASANARPTPIPEAAMNAQQRVAPPDLFDLPTATVHDETGRLEAALVIRALRRATAALTVSCVEEDDDLLAWVRDHRRVCAYVPDTRTERCWWTWRADDGTLRGGDAHALSLDNIDEVVDAVRRIA